MNPWRPPTGWVGVGLLTLMLWIVAWSVQTASWAKGLFVLPLAVTGAVIVSLALARMEWMPGSLAHGWSFVLGVMWTLYLGTRVLPVYDDSLQLGGLTVWERMAAVRDAVAQWLWAARGTSASEGPAASAAPFSGLVFVLAVTLLMWLLSYVCVRFLVRYQGFWGATLPASFALLANLYYAPDTPPSYLALFLLCALLLAARTSVALNQVYWRRARIPYAPDIGIDFLKDAAVVAVAVLALGWLAPVDVGRPPLASMARSVVGSSVGMQTQFKQLFPDLNLPVRGSGGAYSDTMPLTGAISLSSVPIFDVRVEGDRVPRYWRMAVFDLYDGTGWKRTSDGEVDLEAGQTAPRWAATVPVTQTFETFQASTTQLFAAPQPGSFDRPVRGILGPGGDADILAVEARAPLTVGGTYTAVSSLSTAGSARLRSAGDADPGWVRSRYVGLPDSPALAAVAAKAREITAGAGNRYDAADRLENWLRQIPYNEQISTPPEGRDRVAWFIFDERQGYCDYYSSAFVVMARSVGIPARIAAGYSIARPDESGTYRQRASDAHSWPEVFFPQYGWIEFEPTAADMEIVRPADAFAAGEESDAQGALHRGDDPMAQDMEFTDPVDAMTSTGDDTRTGAGPGRWPRWILAALAAAAIMAASGGLVWSRPLRGLSPAEAAFARVVRAAAWVGLRMREVDTPFEYGRRLGRSLPDARPAVETITSAFVAERFGPGGSDEDPAALARAWADVPGPLARFGAARIGRRINRGRPPPAAGRHR